MSNNNFSYMSRQSKWEFIHGALNTIFTGTIKCQHLTILQTKTQYILLITFSRLIKCFCLIIILSLLLFQLLSYFIKSLSQQPELTLNSCGMIVCQFWFESGSCFYNCKNPVDNLEPFKVFKYTVFLWLRIAQFQT